MPGKQKLSPIQSFEVHIADAEWLLETSRVFENKRIRRMRKELRTKIGEALKISARDQDDLDCAESDEVFIIFKPESRVGRHHLRDLAPLRRQAVLAAATALETYVSDAVLWRVTPMISREEGPPGALGRLQLTIGEWDRIEKNYQRHRRGLREIVLNERIPRLASTAPNRIGELLTMLEIENWSKKVDKLRHVLPGTTVRDLDELTSRRNRIAHSSDRLGRDRAPMTYEAAKDYLEISRSVAGAIESMLGNSSIPPTE